MPDFWRPWLSRPLLLALARLDDFLAATLSLGTPRPTLLVILFVVAGVRGEVVCGGERGVRFLIHGTCKMCD